MKNSPSQSALVPAKSVCIDVKVHHYSNKKELKFYTPILEPLNSSTEIKRGRTILEIVRDPFFFFIFRFRLDTSPRLP